ncbi:hypothetical protein DTO006G1_6716 [Penicillium roqueforti]|uniref:uncharacterized protein n=1 Tax=Penicillium roqueforti TaxID=5082 RepID=UPI00190A2BBA|nr:uncharacterized protein LCP9604111_4275 [Penicillium roqueforti]KAF9249646.1 hypothetical protein LCP9604111_4275 [Penicillium roqueforti]KAI1835188.1 hypothetical protein CBS147337_4005 [Penicillium roqueforti]KAI2677201.1 hypothetical protein CBS147355_5428 [Penicillium roqueforti]KAI2688502.1 hypothetical protein LCP963914a_2904 [Penicillium roqueforti]KAI2700678.1 hypothetical protein CBS147372_5457 [Penicillium roqueforti]
MCCLPDLPIEIRLEIAAYLGGQELFAFAQSCQGLYSTLWPTVLTFNVKYQNSILLHLAAKPNDVSLAEALLHCHANVNAFFRGKTPIMRASEHSATKVLKLRCKRQR